MQQTKSELFDVFDFADLSFFYLIAKKNIKFLIIISLLVSTIAYFISLNMEKKYLSEATIVIAADENKIINISEAYSTIQDRNRINNLISTLKSDEVIDYIVNDEKNQLEFKSLYSKDKTNVFSRIFKKKKLLIKNT